DRETRPRPVGPRPTPVLPRTTRRPGGLLLSGSMPAGSPITVWTYISVWLWRLVLLTAGILVTVLAFAAAVKFLAEGRLGPLDTLRFMLYSMPPMLEYALPFAGGLAATLTYHRFASDNEAVACQAGGV